MDSTHFYRHAGVVIVPLSCSLFLLCFLEWVASFFLRRCADVVYVPLSCSCMFVTLYLVGGAYELLPSRPSRRFVCLQLPFRVFGFKCTSKYLFFSSCGSNALRSTCWHRPLSCLELHCFLEWIVRLRRRVDVVYMPLLCFFVLSLCFLEWTAHFRRRVSVVSVSLRYLLLFCICLPSRHSVFPNLFPSFLDIFGMAAPNCFFSTSTAHALICSTQSHVLAPCSLAPSSSVPLSCRCRT